MIPQQRSAARRLPHAGAVFALETSRSSAILRVEQKALRQTGGDAEQFRAEIFPFIQSKVGDAATADDLTPETFVKVSRALAKGTLPVHFRGWLYQIARNRTIDFLKESRRFVPLEDSILNREAGKSESYDSGDNEFRKRLFSYTQNLLAGMTVRSLYDSDLLPVLPLAVSLTMRVSTGRLLLSSKRCLCCRTVELCATVRRCC